VSPPTTSCSRSATAEHLPLWTPEVVVDEALARRLIADRFPELGVESLELVAAGWDNTVWLADGRWAFRFPRREIALPGLERELAVLPALAPLLRLPVPVPRFVGRPTEAYPWPFWGGELVPGRESCELALSDDDRVAVARALAAFLRALHDPAVAAAVRAADLFPVDPNGRADMAVRVLRVREQLADAERAGLWQRSRRADELLDEAGRLPAPKAAVLVHGDLHFRHVLLDAERRPSGVIDWGDVCLADPAVDLQFVWSFLPPAGRPAFLEAYGPVSDEQLLRARVLALSLSAALAVYARAEGLPSVEREAREGLTRTLAGPATTGRRGAGLPLTA